MLPIRKLFPSPSPSFWEFGARSAVWELADYPGLCIRRAEDYRGRLHWKVFDHHPTRSQPIVIQTVERLRDQKFATRREALQAVDAALMSLGA